MSREHRAHGFGQDGDEIWLCRSKTGGASLRQDKSTGTCRSHVVDDVEEFEAPVAWRLASRRSFSSEIKALSGTCPPEAVA